MIPDSVAWSLLFRVGDEITSPPLARICPTVVTPTLLWGIPSVSSDRVLFGALFIPVLPAMTSVFYFAGGAHHAMMGNPDREIETVKRLPTSLRSVCPPLRRIHSTTYEQPQPCCVQRVRNRHVLGELLVRPAVLHTVPKESDYV